MIAFTTAVAEKAGESARWLHFGLTSSDVLDTALALQMRQACDLILKDVDGLLAAVAARAEEHRRTPMIGRTHGVHAEPMTLGVKLALWHAELQRGRVRVCGRVRRWRSARSLARSACSRTWIRRSKRPCVARLGLTPAPVSSQVIQRDRHAELLTSLAILAASLEKFALEIRGLQKTEIGEIEEPFGRGPEGLFRDAAQAESDRVRADHRAGPVDPRQRDGGARERRPLARTRHLAFVRRAGHPAG